LAAGIENLMKLQAGIVGLTESNEEWNIYSYKEQYAKSYRPMAKASRHLYSSSSEMVEWTCFNIYGTVTTILDGWTHRMHKSGKYKAGAGRWSCFTVICKNNTNMI
jgi:hypothetical protein